MTFRAPAQHRRATSIPECKRCVALRIMEIGVGGTPVCRVTVEDRHPGPRRLCWYGMVGSWSLAMDSRFSKRFGSVVIH
jgi:hypothetical protein